MYTPIDADRGTAAHEHAVLPTTRSGHTRLSATTLNAAQQLTAAKLDRFILNDNTNLEFNNMCTSGDNKNNRPETSWPVL